MIYPIGRMAKTRGANAKITATIAIVKKIFWAMPNDLKDRRKSRITKRKINAQAKSEMVR